MSEFLQKFVIALNDGSSYALIALGYTMVYGVLRLINFAHGDIFMLGAFVGAYSARTMNLMRGLPPGQEQTFWMAGLGIVCAMAFCGTAGFTIERIAYRPLRNAPKLSALITAIGVSLFIEYLAQMQFTIHGQKFFGPTPERYPPIAGSGVEFAAVRRLLNISIVPKDILVIGTTLAALLVLRFIVQNTRTGKAMRAVSLNYDSAKLMGININRIISFTFVLGSVLAAVGGCLWGLNRNQCEPLMGIMPGLKAFVAAVIGGIGNIPGAAAGGFLLAFIETYISSVQYHGEAILSPYKDAIAFFLLILVLLFKPEGIFGKSVAEKV